MYQVFTDLVTIILFNVKVGMHLQRCSLFNITKKPAGIWQAMITDVLGHTADLTNNDHWSAALQPFYTQLYGKWLWVYILSKIWCFTESTIKYFVNKNKPTLKPCSKLVKNHALGSSCFRILYLNFYLLVAKTKL